LSSFNFIISAFKYGLFNVNDDENENDNIDVDAHENVIVEDEPNESKMLNKRARNYSSLV